MFNTRNKYKIFKVHYALERKREREGKIIFKLSIICKTL